ncbi:MAG TPA: ABC transporter permease [Burkholderiales bacterium]|nr:ABC transporter permease [Burkholderiales bacterium]
MDRRIITIARYTLLEARRTRLPWLALAILIVVCAASLFIKAIAITETLRLQIAFIAAVLRVAMAFVAGLYVIATTVRELNDKGMELALSLDLPRATWMLGKLAGFSLVAAGLAWAAAIPLLVLAPWPQALAWGVSLMLELWIVIALALFCITTFNQLMPAASFVLAFYLLARSITAIRLIAASPLSDVGGGIGHHIMNGAVKAVAFILPAFDRYTQTAWLVNGTHPALTGIVIQSAIYIALLVAATLFDFYRKNF